MGSNVTESNSPPSFDTRPVFIVRLWWEADGETGEWRGSVERLASGQRHYFRSLSDVSDIIAAQLKYIQPSR